MKDKKVLIGGGLLILAAFWFYIKPNYLDAKPVVPFTQEQIANAARPTLFIGKVPGSEGGGGSNGVVFNLKSTASSPSYVKVIMAIEFEDPEKTYVGIKGADKIIAKDVAFAHELEPEMHKILDVLTRVFGAKTLDQVATTEGKEKLKAELVSALNSEIKGETVGAIYFESFITQ
jgi:hypothetical protein